MNAFRPIVAFALAALFLAIPVRAEDTIPPEFQGSPIDCNTLKNDAEARYKVIFNHIVDGKPTDITKIDEMRKKFWDTYPGDPNNKNDEHAKAREELAQALFEKDLYYLQFNIMARVLDADRKEINEDGPDVPTKAIELMGGKIDGGIHKSAQNLFYRWVDSVRDGLGNIHSTDDILKISWEAGAGVLSKPYRKATNPAGKEYQEYLLERDWSEYDAIKKIPAGFDNDKTYGIYLYTRYGHLGYPEGRAIYQGFVSTIDPRIVQDAAHQVRLAPKTTWGDLEEHVPPPIKKGPGGDDVTDYDVPMPKGVIGVYSSPIVAMEVLATQDDAHRYALYLLKSRFITNRKILPPDSTTKWPYAQRVYATLEHAFGAQLVHDTAEAVRTATKRLAGEGTIMDQKSLGATRNDPLEALEDILCRKNPKGYVLATLAFNQNIAEPDTVDVSAAYQKYISTHNESKVLEAAKKIAGEKPNLGYRDELTYLENVLNGSISLDKPAQTMIDYQEYLAWKGFAPSSKATYIQRTWLAYPADSDHFVPGQISLRHTYTLSKITDDQADLWLTENVFDANGAAHPPHDSELAYPAKVALPVTPAANTSNLKGGSRGKGSAADNTPAPAQASAAPTTIPAYLKTTKDTMLTPGRVHMALGEATDLQSGDETLDIGGKRINTHWTSAFFPNKQDSPVASGKNNGVFVKVWTSDQIPSTFVRKIDEAILYDNRVRLPVHVINEEVLESFQGSRANVTPPADAPAQGATPPAITPVLQVNNAGKTRVAPSDNIPPAAPVVVHADPRASPTNPRLVNPRENANKSPEAAAQTEFYKRFGAMMQRYNTAHAKLRQLEIQRTAIPDDVRAASDSMRDKVAAISAAMGAKDNAAAEENLKAAEDNVNLIEKFLNK